MRDGESTSSANAESRQADSIPIDELLAGLQAQVAYAARKRRQPRGRASLTPGTVLDAKYEIERFLDAGGMAEVYLARELALSGRRVVIKIPKKGANAARFLREQEVAGILGEGPAHASIVQVFTTGSPEGRGDPEGRTFLVTEFVDGLDASTLQRDRGRLSIPDACHIVVDAAAALENAHHKSVVHRDVTPRNIMVSRDGRVKLLDFGLAKIVGSSVDDGQDETVGQAETTLVGTFDYIPPEQWRDASHVDLRADVYALGCTLYTLLTGGPPFGQHASLSAKRRAHETESPPRLSQTRCDVDEQLDAIVAQCLAKDPNGRFASMRDLAAALAPFATGSRLAELVASVAPAADEAADDFVRDSDADARTQASTLSNVGRKRRGTFARLIGGVVSALFLGGLAWLAFGGANPSPLPTELQPPPSPPPTQEFPVTVYRPVYPQPVKQQSPLSRLALVNRPARLEGVDSWSLETAQHRGAVEALAFDPVGRRLATAAADGTVRIWDCSGDQLTFVKAFVGHDDPVRTLAWSPDGKRLASGSEDQTTRVWDVDTGRWTVLGHASAVQVVAWSPDGQTIAMGGLDGKIRLRRLDDGTSHTRNAHQSVITSLAWSPDGAKLASSSGDRTIRIEDAEGGDERTWGPLEGTVSLIAWHPREARIISVVGRSLRTFDSTDGTQQLSLEIPTNPMAALAWSPAVEKMAGVTQFGEVWVLSVDAPPKTLAMHSATSVAWTTDGTMLAIGGHHGAVEIRRTADLDRAIVSLAGHPGMRPDGWDLVTTSPDGTRIASTHQDGSLRVWDAATGKQWRVFEGSPRSTATQIAWSASGAKIAVSGRWAGFLVDSACEFRMYDVETEESIANRRVRSPSVSPDGRLLASLANDGVAVHETETGRLVQVFESRDRLQSLRWSPRGNYLFALSGDSPMRLWDVATGKPIPLGEEFETRPRFALWSPTDETLAFPGLRSDAVLAWDGRLGQQRELIKSGESIRSLAWFADGATVLTDDGDGEFKQWNAETGELVRSISVEASGIYFLLPRVSPNGRVASARAFTDGAITCWDLETGKRLRTFRRDIASPLAMAWTESGSSMIINQGGCVRRLDLPDLQTSATLVPLRKNDAIVVSASGHYVPARERTNDLIVVVQRANEQRSMTPAEFQAEHAWHNDPGQVRFADEHLAPQ